MSKGSRAAAWQRMLRKPDKAHLFAYQYGSKKVSLSAVRREYKRRGIHLVRPGYLDQIKGRRATMVIMDDPYAHVCREDAKVTSLLRGTYKGTIIE